ncbi:MAG TPA: adenosine deaminase [Candidatus Obscuribacterales bacterium]
MRPPISLSFDSELHHALLALPKAEIHVHLEGSLSPETVWELAQGNGTQLPADSLEQWRSFYSFTDFAHFIEVYGASVQCLRSPGDYARMLDSFLAGQAAQNIRYTEAFLSCSLALSRMKAGLLIETLSAAKAAAEARHGVKLKLIADIARQFPERQEQVLELALASEGLFIGIGLGGKEAGFPPELFTETYARARAAGLHVVAHAGEAAGADSVRAAVERLGAERIGHGVRCLEDPALVRELARRRLPLEVCPVSNYCLGIVAPDQPHPIRRMLDAGLFCTLNSDDPSMFGTSLLNEYLILAGQGFSLAELQQLSQNTWAATFLEPTERTKLSDEKL